MAAELGYANGWDSPVLWGNRGVGGVGNEFNGVHRLDVGGVGGDESGGGVQAGAVATLDLCGHGHHYPGLVPIFGVPITAITGGETGGWVDGFGWLGGGFELCLHGLEYAVKPLVGAVECPGFSRDTYGTWALGSGGWVGGDPFWLSYQYQWGDW